MPYLRHRPFLYVVACALTLLAGMGPTISVQTETIFLLTLTGAAEVPPNGSPATDFATFALNDAFTVLSFEIEYSGLVGARCPVPTSITRLRG